MGCYQADGTGSVNVTTLQGTGVVNLSTAQRFLFLQNPLDAPCQHLGLKGEGTKKSDTPALVKTESLALSLVQFLVCVSRRLSQPLTGPRCCGRADYPWLRAVSSRNILQHLIHLFTGQSDEGT